MPANTVHNPEEPAAAVEARAAPPAPPPPSPPTHHPHGAGPAGTAGARRPAGLSRYRGPPGEPGPCGPPAAHMVCPPRSVRRGPNRWPSSARARLSGPGEPVAISAGALLRGEAILVVGREHTLPAGCHFVDEPDTPGTRVISPADYAAGEVSAIVSVEGAVAPDTGNPDDTLNLTVSVDEETLALSVGGGHTLDALPVGATLSPPTAEDVRHTTAARPEPHVDAPRRDPAAATVGHDGAPRGTWAPARPWATPSTTPPAPTAAPRRPGSWSPARAAWGTATSRSCAPPRCASGSRSRPPAPRNAAPRSGSTNPAATAPPPLPPSTSPGTTSPRKRTSPRSASRQTRQRTHPESATTGRVWSSERSGGRCKPFRARRREPYFFVSCLF